MAAKKRYTAGSLFSGIGGIDLAFSLAGFDILFQVEIDEFCQKVLAKHSKEYWPNAEIFADVRAVGQHNLPTVDILFGGFPCQDISNAGKREGLVAGKRSSLWFEFARIISELRPGIVLLENVEAITTPRKKEDGQLSPPDMAVVVDTLASMGYSARWGIIAASDAGAPHQRNRWFCLAHTERRGLLSAATTIRRANPCDKIRDIETGFGEQVACSPLSNSDLLPEQEGLAHANRQRRPEIRGYRAKARKRLISASALGVAQSTGRKRFIRRPLPQFLSSQASGRQGSETRGSTKPRMGRDAYGISSKLDGAGLMAHRWPARPNELQHDYEPPRLVGEIVDRRNRIKSLGNAVVPQVVYPIAIEIMKLLERE
jgi:DNA (cytosine-5)-methyltransferase 1